MGIGILVITCPYIFVAFQTSSLVLYCSSLKTIGFLSFCFTQGIIGAVQAFLTPQLNNFDGTNYEYLEYYLSHGGIMLLPIFMLKNLGYELTKYSWLKVVLYLNILLAIVMPLNFIIDSNYMYLASTPDVNNPLIIGSWPYYILFWEVIVVILTYILYVISTGKRI